MEVEGAGEKVDSEESASRVNPKRPQLGKRNWWWFAT